MSVLLEKLFQEEVQGLFYLKPDNAKGLAEVCQRFIAAYPDFHKPYLTLALIARKAGLSDQALCLTRQAMDKAPFDRQVQNMYRSLKESA